MRRNDQVGEAVRRRTTLAHRCRRPSEHLADCRFTFRRTPVSLANAVLGTIRMNTPQTVTKVLSELAELGIAAALCGGWAEQAFGLCRPRDHKDIDLVVEAGDFSKVDESLRNDTLKNEIVAKRFAHKRAFSLAETPIEMYLVQPRPDRFVTLFWGDSEYTWLSPLTATTRLAGIAVRAVTPENLSRFRRSYSSHQPWRWRDPASLVLPS